MPIEFTDIDRMRNLWRALDGLLQEVQQLGGGISKFDALRSYSHRDRLAQAARIIACRGSATHYRVHGQNVYEMDALTVRSVLVRNGQKPHRIAVGDSVFFDAEENSCDVLEITHPWFVKDVFLIAADRSQGSLRMVPASEISVDRSLRSQLEDQLKDVRNFGGIRAPRDECCTPREIVDYYFKPRGSKSVQAHIEETPCGPCRDAEQLVRSLIDRRLQGMSEICREVRSPRLLHKTELSSVEYCELTVERGFRVLGNTERIHAADAAWFEHWLREGKAESVRITPDRHRDHLGGSFLTYRLEGSIPDAPPAIAQLLKQNHRIMVPYPGSPADQLQIILKAMGAAWVVT